MSEPVYQIGIGQYRQRGQDDDVYTPLIANMEATVSYQKPTMPQDYSGLTAINPWACVLLARGVNKLPSVAVWAHSMLTAKICKDSNGMRVSAPR